MGRWAIIGCWILFLTAVVWTALNIDSAFIFLIAGYIPDTSIYLSAPAMTILLFVVIPGLLMLQRPFIEWCWRIIEQLGVVHQRRLDRRQHIQAAHAKLSSSDLLTSTALLALLNTLPEHPQTTDSEPASPLSTAPAQA